MNRHGLILLAAVVVPLGAVVASFAGGEPAAPVAEAPAFSADAQLETVQPAPVSADEVMAVAVPVPAIRPIVVASADDATLPMPRSRPVLTEADGARSEPAGSGPGLVDRGIEAVGDATQTVGSAIDAAYGRSREAGRAVADAAGALPGKVKRLLPPW